MSMATICRIVIQTFGTSSTTGSSRSLLLRTISFVLWLGITEHLSSRFTDTTRPDATTIHIQSFSIPIVADTVATIIVEVSM